MRNETSIDWRSVGRIDAIGRILEVVCRATGLGFSAVAQVTDCQWIACAVRDEIAFGLKPGEELVLETTICNEIRQSHKLVVIDEVRVSEAYRDHPTPKMYGFQSYISVPIFLPDGGFFGTLCAIDPSPAKVDSPAIVGMFKLFAELIALHIESEHRVSITEVALEAERELARIQAQYIAVLGHDLRNPLAAIQFGTDILSMEPQSETSAEVIAAISRSVSRIEELIGNVLDHARKRHGGIRIQQTQDENLCSALGQVVSELQLVSPDRQIDFECSIDSPVQGDTNRICQMLSNLVANALMHGAPSTPVKVFAFTDEHSFEMWVENSGETISPEKIERLFEPFARGESVRADGLGLGLFIAMEIARAHKGSLKVESEDNRTRFTFRMPTAG